MRQSSVVPRGCLRPLHALICALLAVASAPAAAQWVEFADETGTRLSGDAATLLDDTEEKDYAWGDVDKDTDIDLVVVRKEPFTTSGKRTNLLLLNEGGVLYDMNYGPAHAPMRRWCAEHQVACEDGLGMLVGQAAVSFGIWTGFEPDVAPVIEALSA